MASTEEKEMDLERDFNWEEYVPYFPEAQDEREYLESMFAAREYGWKSRAKLLISIKKTSTYLNDLTDRLRAKARILGNGHGKVVEKLTRWEHLRRYLQDAPDSELQQMAKLTNVSYNSYKDNKTELIEIIVENAITDETEGEE